MTVLSTIIYSGFAKEKRGKKKTNNFSVYQTWHTSLNCFVGPQKVEKAFLGSHFEDCSSSASNQELNMKLFAALVFSCSIVLSHYSVPSASGQPDIVKRMETCQEGINTVSEQSVTKSLFGQLSPKGWRGILELSFNSSENRCVLAFLGQYLDPVLYTTDESQNNWWHKCMAYWVWIELIL